MFCSSVSFVRHLSYERSSFLCGFADITIPSKRGPQFGVLKRVPEVFDCWYLLLFLSHSLSFRLSFFFSLIEVHAWNKKGRELD